MNDTDRLRGPTSTMTTPRDLDPERRIGFLCGWHTTSATPRPYILNRAAPMATVLRDFGTELLLYAPNHVDARTGIAHGHVIGNDRLVPKQCPVPPVNGDWYLGECAPMPGGMDRPEFRRWTRAHDIAVYPDPNFARTLKDKLETYHLLNDLGIPHPVTAVFDGSRGQIEAFLDRSPVAFIKPNRGNSGHDISVLRVVSDGYTLRYYARGGGRQEHFASLAAALDDVTARSDGKTFVIQEGIEAVGAGDDAFIVRIIMVHDGQRWHWLHKVVVAPDGRDVANTSMGGRNFTLDDFFGRLYGIAECVELNERIRALAFDVTQRLDTRFENRIMELAFDLVLDADGNVSIVELNTKPGMMKPGLPKDGFPDIFNLTPEEEIIYGRLVVPHATYLAMFLQERLEARERKTAEIAAQDGWRDAHEGRQLRQSA